MKRFSFTLLLVSVLVPTAYAADVIIVDEDFEGYADQAAFKATWVPTAGSGNTAPLNPADEDDGYLIGCATCPPITDPANYPGIQGQAADHIGAISSLQPMVNQYGGLTPAFTIAPSATESVSLSADVFVGSSGNERMTVGLRSRAPSNLLEMGAYNANTCDPTVAGCVPGTSTGTADIPSTGYAYRLQSFQSVSAPLLVQPNWQYFQLPIELDRTTDADTLVNIADIGAGWHTYTATITPDTITVTMDLFRDGLRNTSTTPDPITGIRPGTPGLDASQTWPITTNLANGFNSLRIGGPSGVSSAGTGFMGFDNILLKLVDVAPANTADFNGNGVIDAADYVVWRNNNGLMGTGTQATGDANGDTNVDMADYDAWKATFGNSVPGSGALVGGAVPEPATIALLIVGVAALALGRRR